MYPSWHLFLCGSGLGLALSLVLIRVMGPLGWMDHPDKTRKKHGHPTALTGGVTLWITLMVGTHFRWLAYDLHPMDWVAIHAMAIMGLVDDRFHVSARYKALVGFVVAGFVATHGWMTLGAQVHGVHFLGFPIPGTAWVIIPVLTLWYWSLPHAYNLIDGINGLSMGFGLLALTVLSMNLHTSSAFLIGSLAAVLLLNYPRAWHFLGDCGALMLGTLFAILSVNAFALSNPNMLLWIFAYPAIDVSLVVATRLRRGHGLGAPDRSHLHHWMIQQLGPGRGWLATPLLLALAFFPMLRATPLAGSAPLSAVGLLALLGLAVHVFLQQTRGPRLNPEVKGAELS